MRLDNIPTQHRVVLLQSGNPMQKFIKGGIVIHSDLRPCLVEKVDVHQTAKHKTEGFANIFLKEIGTVTKFQPKWKNLKTLGTDNTTYTEFKKGIKLTVQNKYFIQPCLMKVAEDVKERAKDGLFRIMAKERLYDKDDTSSDDPSCYTEILTLSLDGLLDNPKVNKILTGEGTKRKKARTSGWRLPNGCTTGSHTNPNPKPNPKPNPLANPTSFYAYDYVHIK